MQREAFRTRFLGHYRADGPKVVHDLDRETGDCQVDRILGDGVATPFWPDTYSQARVFSYLPCPHCLPAAQLEAAELVREVKPARADHPRVFERISIGGLTLPNRIVHEPTTLNMSDQAGYATAETTRVYEEIAAGGVGLTIVGATCVRRDGLINERMLGLYDDTYIIGLKDVAAAIHYNDSVAAIQLFYGGLIPGLGSHRAATLAPGEGWIPGTRNWGASDKAFIGNRQPGVLGTSDYEEIVEAFGLAARRAQIAGFDAISLHFCHGSLPMTTLSLHSNQGREDKYADRVLFSAEIIERIKAECGADYPVWPRVCCDQNLVGDYDIDYCLAEYAPRWEAAGADVLDCTFGSMIMAVPRNPDAAGIAGGIYTPEALNFENIRRMKQGQNLPVIGSCRLGTPESIQLLIEEERADLVGLCRALMADPFLPKKMEAGQADQIRKTVWSGASLVTGNIFNYGHAGAVDNPVFGFESTFDRRPGRSRRVVIVGGGPGGLEAARVSAERGHEVVLFEAADRLGGQLAWAGQLPWVPQSQVLAHPVEFLEGELGRLGVDVRLGQRVGLEELQANEPDAVVLATGASEALPDEPWLASLLEAGRACTLQTALAGGLDEIASVVIWGANLGLEPAIHFARAGIPVSLVDERSGPGELAQSAPAYLPSALPTLLSWLASEPIALHFGKRVSGGGDGHIMLTDAEGQGEEVAAERLIVTLGMTATNELEAEIRKHFANTFVIGDARGPRSIGHALHEGARVALRLEHSV